MALACCSSGEFCAIWAWPRAVHGGLIMPGAGAQSPLFARSSSCDITPRGRPVRLAGYPSRTEPVSTILDNIEISAVLLESTAQRCLILSLDLMIVGSELKQMI